MAFGDRLKGLQERLDREAKEHREELDRGEARRLIQLLESQGHQITLKDSGGITVSPKPDPETVRLLVKSKAALVQVLWNRQNPEAPVK